MSKFSIDQSLVRIVKIRLANGDTLKMVSQFDAVAGRQASHQFHDGFQTLPCGSLQGAERADATALIQPSARRRDFFQLAGFISAGLQATNSRRTGRRPNWPTVSSAYASFPNTAPSPRGRPPRRTIS